MCDFLVLWFYFCLVAETHSFHLLQIFLQFFALLKFHYTQVTLHFRQQSALSQLLFNTILFPRVIWEFVTVNFEKSAFPQVLEHMIKFNFWDLFPFNWIFNSGLDFVDRKVQVPTNVFEFWGIDIFGLQARPCVINEDFVVFVKFRIFYTKSVLNWSLLILYDFFMVFLENSYFVANIKIDLEPYTSDILIILRYSVHNFLEPWDNLHS